MRSEVSAAKACALPVSTWGSEEVVYDGSVMDEKGWSGERGESASVASGRAPGVPKVFWAQCGKLM